MGISQITNKNKKPIEKKELAKSSIIADVDALLDTWKKDDTTKEDASASSSQPSVTTSVNTSVTTSVADIQKRLLEIVKSPVIEKEQHNALDQDSVSLEEMDDNEDVKNIQETLMQMQDISDDEDESDDEEDRMADFDEEYDDNTA